MLVGVGPLLRKGLVFGAAVVMATQAFGSECAVEYDRARAEELFKKRCQSCHVVADEDGTVLAGRKSRNGPNLYGLAGNTFAADEEYTRYGKTMKEGRDAGLTWDVAGLSDYLLDPKGFLQGALGADKVSNRMAFRLKEKADADLLARFLADFPQCRDN